MPFEIDPREVLEHLEYLGYTSITKDQLTDFIRDLKKLIKYEKSKEKKALTVHDAQHKVSVACETSLPLEALCASYRHEDAFSSLVHMENHSSNHQCSFAKSGTSNIQRSCRSENFDVQIKPQDIGNDLCCKQCGKKHFKSCGMKDCFETDKQPCPSFIRPGICKPTKCDPVALYHYYQTEWSKKPLPGEDPRSDLRWAVRTRLAQKQQQQPIFPRKITSVDGIHRRKIDS